MEKGSDWISGVRDAYPRQDSTVTQNPNLTLYRHVSDYPCRRFPTEVSNRIW